MRTPTLTFYSKVLGRTVVMMGHVQIGSIENFNGKSNTARWVHVHLPEVPQKRIQSANDNTARTDMQRAVEEWLCAAGILVSGESVQCVDASSDTECEVKRARS